MAFSLERKTLLALWFIHWTCAFPALSHTLDEASVAATHEQWMAMHGRTYANDAEKEKRFKIFKENLEYIENFNDGKSNSYKLGLNHFADLTTEEFIASHTGLGVPGIPRSSKNAPFRPLNLADVPESLDWREKGAVTPIKNQGVCGSCWAFSAIAAIEGLVKIKTGKLISLSEQQLIDCSRQLGTHGCRGGWMDKAFRYIIENQGIASETNYTYKARDGTCNTGSAAMAAAQITGYGDVPANSEEQLLLAVANQPVSVALSASKDFMFYESGVFTGKCHTSLNHAVTFVGYGKNEDGMKYWIVKNSWSGKWGESGYMKLQRDSGKPHGLCGLAKKASYPTV
ncbi:hypothetical protein L6164_036823 [Bauhinia variegata]|uniref:Uncharacterized protein n=1 Tax=Bauhinia variegata TaxID=167791 RepID=A0ACB9KI73_BAUVA|nr:hypothetical protein L6164_036823 [Bauhinia variegata]